VKMLFAFLHFSASRLHELVHSIVFTNRKFGNKLVHMTLTHLDRCWMLRLNVQDKREGTELDLEMENLKSR
jgi:hypothetical protein